MTFPKRLDHPMSERQQRANMRPTMRDLLWWAVMAAFLCGAMTVPVYPSSSPVLSRAGYAAVLLITAWRVRWVFHRIPD
jgi:hypothetical protein